MSYTKRFLEQVSEKLGYGGAINDEVITKASKILAEGIDSAYSITELYQNLSTEHQNETTGTNNPGVARRKTDNG